MAAHWQHIGTKESEINYTAVHVIVLQWLLMLVLLYAVNDKSLEGKSFMVFDKL